MPNIIYYIFNIPLAYMEKPEGLFYLKIINLEIIVINQCIQKISSQSSYCSAFLNDF